MEAIRGRVKEDGGREIEFDLPVKWVADALDVSAEELMRACDERKIGYRKITDQDSRLVIQVEAYARHCTLTVEGQ